MRETKRRTSIARSPKRRSPSLSRPSAQRWTASCGISDWSAKRGMRGSMGGSALARRARRLVGAVDGEAAGRAGERPLGERVTGADAPVVGLGDAGVRDHQGGRLLRVGVLERVRGVVVQRAIGAVGKAGIDPEGEVCRTDHLRDQRVEARLAEAGLPFVAVREPDPPWSGALMAIGLRPLRRSHELRRLLSRLRLAGPSLTHTTGEP